MYEAAPHPKAFYLVPGAGHNDCPVVGGANYYARLVQFIASIVQ